MSSAGSAVPHGSDGSQGYQRTTFLQKLGKQRNVLGHAALSASICFLAVRILAQQKEMDQVKEDHRQQVEALKAENQILRDRLGSPAEAIEEKGSGK